MPDYIDQRSLLTLQAFRSIFISWAVHYFPAHDMKQNASYAARAARGAHDVYDTDTVKNAADAVADAAYAVRVIDPDYSLDVLGAAAYSAFAARYAADASSVVDAAVDADCAWLIENQGLGHLIDQPLWLIDVRGNEKYLANFPDWVRKPFDDFVKQDRWELGASRLLIANWYRALLPNSPTAIPKSAFGKEADLVIATQPNEFWKVSEDRSAKQIFDEIAAIILEHKSDKEVGSDLGGDGSDVSEFEQDIAKAVDNLEPQAPAAYRFGWQEGRLAALPPADVASDPQGAQIFLEEVRRKAVSLQAQLEGSNSDRRVKQSIDGLLDILPERVEDLRPQLLRSRARSIAADAAAYGAANGELELFPGAVAALLDLSEIARDLQGYYPQLRDLEAEIAALDLDPNRLEEARDNLDQIVEVAKGEADLIDPSAKAALEKVQEIAAEEAPKAVLLKRISEYGLVVGNFLFKLARPALDNAFTREAKRLGSDIYQKLRPQIVDGVADGAGSMVKPATIGAIVSLVYSFFGPMGVLGTMAVRFGKTDILFKIVAKLLEKKIDSKEDSDGKDDAKPSGEALE
ncbi:MAG: hypothetical protein OIF58_09845 [Cohaesibacter sp.]|nr:hypothetical protein [Cohaesibacter sp.]